MGAQSAGGLGQEGLGICHEIVQIFGCPIEIGLEEVHSIGQKTGV